MPRPPSQPAAGRATPAPRGFLNIDKPAGMTSFDVIRRIRRAAGTRKVGHAGTLDPLATGVLPIAIGEATKLVDQLVGATKRYRAVITLGVETDTYDANGATVRRQDASSLTRDEIEQALEPFHGEQLQTPPAFSAVKRDGVRAYAAARKGKPHRLDPRPVAVHSLALLDVQRAAETVDATVDIECGKGFYVRSLAHDLGAALGVGGHVRALCRTAVGALTVARATGLDRACEQLEAGNHDQLVHAPDIVLDGWPALILGGASAAAVRDGRDVRPHPLARRAGAAGERVRCYDAGGRLIALAEATAAAGSWHPFRVFAPETSSQ